MLICGGFKYPEKCVNVSYHTAKKLKGVYCVQLRNIHTNYIPLPQFIRMKVNHFIVFHNLKHPVKKINYEAVSVLFGLGANK